MNGYRPQGYRNRLIIPRLLFPDRRTLAEQGQSSRGGPDDRAPVYHFPRDQPSFVRILPAPEAGGRMCASASITSSYVLSRTVSHSRRSRIRTSTVSSANRFHFTSTLTAVT